MARRKIYYKWELPCAVVEIVRGICADYDRRENAIKYSNVTGGVLERYVELNSAVDAALEDLEVGLRKDMIEDVALNRGYDFSRCSTYVSKCTYYNKKRKLIYDIAERLFLVPGKNKL